MSASLCRRHLPSVFGERAGCDVDASQGLLVALPWYGVWLVLERLKPAQGVRQGVRSAQWPSLPCWGQGLIPNYWSPLSLCFPHALLQDPCPTREVLKRVGPCGLSARLSRGQRSDALMPVALLRHSVPCKSPFSSHSPSLCCPHLL